jgi:hypothetical protein
LFQPWNRERSPALQASRRPGGLRSHSRRTARRSDVGDDQVKASGRAGRGRRDVRAELNRTPRAGLCELDDPEAVIEREVRVEPPPEAPVELLRAIDIRDGDDDHLELQVDVLTLAIPLASLLRTSVVVIAASLGGVRDDRRAVTAASHQAHTLVCVLRRPRSRMYVRAGTGGKGSFGTSPVSPHSMDPGVREAVPDRLGLVIFVPSCGPRVDR